LINWVHRKWVDWVLWPIHRRRMRNGVTALMYLQDRMKAVRWPRQRRRQVMRQMIRSGRVDFMYDLLYNERDLKRRS
jgi:hypothetical protein